MLLKTHLDIISRNEPIQRKAKFWSSYMRALKGTDDMRAPEQSTRAPRSTFRPLFAEFPEVAAKLDSWPYSKSIYDEPTQAHDRISSPGYRYQPISRDTYGYGPRTNLSSQTYRPDYIEYEPTDSGKKVLMHNHPDNMWDAHLQRLADIEVKYPKPSPYSDLTLKYPSPATYRPSVNRIPYALYHAAPVAPRPSYSYTRPSNAYRLRSPTPSEKAIGYTYSGTPIYSQSGLPRLALYDLLNPSPYTPVSRIVRDPWWWRYPELRPYESPYSWRYSPSYLRSSYLSPVKSTYLWTHHPIRPFCK